MDPLANMPLSSTEIATAIRNGFCKKAVIPDFEHLSYFVDPDGYVYSMFNAAQPRRVPMKLGTGLMWVALFTKDGVVKRRRVGDIVAHTFLMDSREDEAMTTVMYKDGDARNNSASNLEWCTELQQQHQLRDMQNDTSGAGVHEVKADKESVAREPLVPLTTEVAEDPFLSQLHEIQKQLREAESRVRVLEEAVAPFGSFILSPIHASAPGSSSVIESNCGTDQESRLTVHDFRVAQQACGR